ncbi:MAG: DUF5995 family protein [Alphaproteobacteria bacterium]
MLSPDERLMQVAARAVTTISDVIIVLQDMDSLLPNDDGLKWFNLLYLKVTEGVRDNPPSAGWEAPLWLERLDVVFAHLYLDAVVSWQRNPTKTARSWVPLFESRRRSDIMRIQFALAGMNAHINHDLPVALVQVNGEKEVQPDRRSAEYRDFDYVNDVLEAVEGKIKPYVATGIVGVIDEDLGEVDDVIAMWNVRKARETAWVNAELLWHLGSVPVQTARDDFLTNLDRLVSLGSRGLLVPVGLK